MKLRSLICLVCFISASFTVFASDNPKERIKESLESAESVQHLPKARSMVIFGKLGQAIVLTDNPRWVVKGTLFDMWQNKEIHSQSDLNAAKKLLPLDKLNLNTSGVLDVMTRPEKKKKLVVFLDPYAPNSPSVISILTKYASEYKIHWIFTAVSQKSVEKLGSFACLVAQRSGSVVLDRIKNEQLPTVGKVCDQKRMMNSYGLSQFLHISTSPTLIAPNDVYSEGMPVKLMQWLSENKEGS